MPWVALSFYFYLNSAIRLVLDAHDVAQNFSRVLIYNIIACGILISTFWGFRSQTDGREIVKHVPTTFSDYKLKCLQTHILRARWASKAHVLAKIALGHKVYARCLAIWVPFVFLAIAVLGIVTTSAASNSVAFAAGCQMAAIQRGMRLGSGEFIDDVLSTSSVGLSLLLELSLSAFEMSLMVALFILWGLYICYVVWLPGQVLYDI